MRFAFFICALFLGIKCPAQSSPDKVVEKFFEHFNNHDSAAIKTLCIDNLALYTVHITGKDTLFALGNPEEMYVFVSTWKAQYKEEIGTISTIADELVAVVSVPYQFYLRNALMHCGINQFQLAIIGGKWKILSITDSRKLCSLETKSPDKTAIYSLLDSWHLAAGKADGNAYYQPMHEQFVYMGTDPKERWTKAEFIQFCEPHFKKGKGWAFKAVERHIEYSENLQTAWIDEVLDTWMGPCRGTAVLQKENDHWMLMHYSLSVLVPNNKMDQFLKAVWNKKKK